MSVKRITVWVSPELDNRATEVAAQHQESLNQFVAEAIEAYIRCKEAEAGRWPLGELTALLAPAAWLSELGEVLGAEAVAQVMIHAGEKRVVEQLRRRGVELQFSSKLELPRGRLEMPVE